MPTLLASPWPSGPVVVSTPLVQRYSGWPGQRLPSCRKRLTASSGTDGSPRASYSLLTAFTPVRCSSEYNSIEAWPTESTKRSRLGQIGSCGSKRRKCCHRQYATGARAIGVPGWPELAACTASIDSVRMVLTQVASRSLLPSMACVPWVARFRSIRPDALLLLELAARLLA